MPLSKETLELAARFDADQAALKRAKVELAASLQAEKKRRAAFDESYRKRMSKDIHVLEVAAKESGNARAEVEAAVPGDVRDSLSLAESDLRAIEPKVRDASYAHALAKEDEKRFADAGSDKVTMKEAQRKVVKAEAALAEVLAEKKRIQARIDVARKHYRTALETVKAGR